jgi:hypothetical protein
VVESYELVQLKNGAFSIRSVAEDETFHPVIGPVAEAEALYIRQLDLIGRLRRNGGEFVVWDVGLGAAANPLSFLAAAAEVPKPVRIVSFDRTIEPLRFALKRSAELGYLTGFTTQMRELADKGRTRFELPGGLSGDWDLHLADFPELLAGPAIATWPKPHAIFYDAFSPQKNPAMWTLDVFSRLYCLLDPARPCAMPTYSRSTMLRVTLLLAGFYVGVGHATGEKEETTIAANSLELMQQPLGREWLARARRSRSAEPLHSPEYRQAPLRPETWEHLSEHPQFR